MTRREVLGFWYDPETKRFFETETSVMPVSLFTFNDLYNVSIFPFWPSRPLNPFYAPTEETAKNVFDWAKKVAGQHVSGLRLVQEPIKSSPFARWSHPEWSLYADSIKHESGSTDAFSVGLLASSLLRGNGIWLTRAFEAELRDQGAWF